MKLPAIVVLYALLGTATLACSHQKRSMPATQKLGHELLILQEAIIGLHAPDPSEAMLNVNLPLERTILGRNRISLGACEGPEVDAASTRNAALAELEVLLGGVFSKNLLPEVTMHSSLVSDAELAKYSAPGIQVSLDKPQVAYYHLVHTWRDWQVHALGEPGRFHAVFIGKEIPASTALLPDGTVSDSIQPEVVATLGEICPKIRLNELTEVTDLPRSNWIAGWDGDKITLRIGVRQWVRDEVSLETRYFAGARINWIAG